MINKRIIRRRWAERFPSFRARSRARWLKEVSKRELRKPTYMVGSPDTGYVFGHASSNPPLKWFASQDEFYFGFSDLAQEHLSNFYEEFSYQRDIWEAFDDFLAEAGVPSNKWKYIEFPATEHGEFGVMVRRSNMNRFTPKELKSIWKAAWKMDRWVCRYFKKIKPPRYEYRDYEDF